MEILAFVVAHATDFLQIAFAAHALALLIVNLTPTPKDNIVLARIYSVIEVVAGIVTKTAKT